MPYWSSQLEIIKPLVFPMIPYRHLGLLASTNRALRAAVDKVWRNFTYITWKGQEYERYEFTIYSCSGESLKIRTAHPFTSAILFKLDDNWYLESLSTMDKQMPYNSNHRTEYMPLVLYKAGCKICAEPLARNETIIWFSKTPMGKVEYMRKQIDKVCLTLYLGCNLGQGGFTVSSAYITYYTEE
jgi:hypothetical protein